MSAQPYIKRKIQIFSQDQMVQEIAARDSCKTLYGAVASEISTHKVDCGRRTYRCLTGWRYYGGYANCVGGTQNGSCWRRNRSGAGNARFCGWKAWDVAYPIPVVVTDHQSRHLVVVTEPNPRVEIARWTSEWFCTFRPNDRNAYNQARPSVSSQVPVWCPDDHALCGSPCAGDREWCCLDCQSVSQQLKQLAQQVKALQNPSH